MSYGNVSERQRRPPDVGVSVVIMALGPDGDGQEPAATHEPHGLWLPLVKRTRQPYLGDWALPGGELRADRALDRSAYLALESTTKLRPNYLEQLHTFGDTARSRKGLPMVSIVYWALVGRAEANDFIEADNVRWFAESQLPDLAFDHRRIIEYALTRLRSRMAYPDIATKLVGSTFTLRQLHGVYEAVTGQLMDLANFRRKMLASRELESTGDKISEGRQRPAALYRYVSNLVAAAEHTHSHAAQPPSLAVFGEPLDALAYGGPRDRAVGNMDEAMGESDELSALTTTDRTGFGRAVRQRNAEQLA